MRRFFPILVLVPLLVCAGPGLSRVNSSNPIPPPEQLVIRVIDVGVGLSCVAKIPGDDGPHYMIYDAGLRENAMDDIREIIPEESKIDLLVLSHADSDHLGAVPLICEEYKVQTILRTGWVRTGIGTWTNADAAIAKEATQGCAVFNLRENPLPPGATFKVGSAFATMVSGFGVYPSTWVRLTESKRRNAVSIVIRLQYKGASVLFAGDAVGRKDGGDSDQILASEKFMVDMSEAIPIKSDVLIAPHHGADNASSKLFIETVNPTWVIFSAGHHATYRHPRKTTAERIIATGINADHILRTDRGDDEGPDEWDHERVPGDNGGKADDDIEITIKKNGKVSVKYMSAS